MFEYVAMEPILKIGVAAILGAIIGLERGTHGRPAGLRTHALVCMASALLIVVSRTGALSGLASPDKFIINVDPARMAAGIVTGIGFLGAGAILRIGNSLVRGLTTAACIWFVAAVGIAIGMGAYLLAVTCTFIALFILILLDRAEGAMGSVAYRTLVIDLEETKRQNIEQQCINLLESNGIRVQQTTYELDKAASKATISFSLRLKINRESDDIFNIVTKLEGVDRIKWY